MATGSPADREGLTICDATSRRLRHGPALGQARCHHLLLAEGAGRRSRARHADPVARAPWRGWKATRPPGRMPKIFRMTKGGKIVEGIFEGETINTPSMVAVEDYLDALTWAESVGGLKGLIARSNANLQGAGSTGSPSPAGPASWREDAAIRSNTSVCIEDHRSLVHRPEPTTPRPTPPRRSPRCWRRKAWRWTSPAIAPRRRACASGAAPRWTQADIEALTPWLDWAWAQVKNSSKAETGKEHAHALHCRK